MNKRLFSLCFFLCLALLVACQAPAPTATSVPSTATLAPPTTAPTAAATQGAAILKIIGPAKTVELTLDEVRKLPYVEGYAGIKNSAGKITPPVICRGVLFAELAKLVGGIAENRGINVVAKDGYMMTFSYDQAINARLITYDPGTGDEFEFTDKLQVILAYEMDGKPLDEVMDGNLRVMGISPKNNQVIDGHWTVKWITQVQLKAMAEEWELKLHGTLKEPMDRASFESCAAPGCHGRQWTDEQGQEWSGVPLWLLVGRVDDETRHQSRAFSDALAEAGYTIDVTAADGYSVTLQSRDIRFDDEYLVANKMNGQLLENKYFPLRLVGPKLSKKELVGQLASIALNIPAAALAKLPTATPAPSPTAAPAAPTTAPTLVMAAPTQGSSVVISGRVFSPGTLSSADLQAIGLATIEAEHPKKGKQTYQGVRFGALFARVGVKPEVKKIIFTATDGYKAEVPFGDVNACADCMLAIGEDGSLSAVMPSLASSTWAKNVAQIDLQ